MASIFMRLEGVEVKGGATQVGLEGTGWFAISSYSWGASRAVGMDVGNGNNADSGMVALSEVNITKEADGATEQLLSFLFNPGKEGKTIEIAFTKPGPDGSGAQVYFQVKLTLSRASGYQISGSDGMGGLMESISLSYVEISMKYNYELENGEIKDGGIVAYNVPKGKLLSGA